MILAILFPIFAYFAFRVGLGEVFVWFGLAYYAAVGMGGL